MVLNVFIQYPEYYEKEINLYLHIFIIYVHSIKPIHPCYTNLMPLNILMIAKVY